MHANLYKISHFTIYFLLAVFTFIFLHSQLELHLKSEKTHVNHDYSELVQNAKITPEWNADTQISITASVYFILDKPLKLLFTHSEIHIKEFIPKNLEKYSLNCEFIE